MYKFFLGNFINIFNYFFYFSIVVNLFIRLCFYVYLEGWFYCDDWDIR